MARSLSFRNEPGRLQHHKKGCHKTGGPFSGLPGRWLILASHGGTFFSQLEIIHRPRCEVDIKRHGINFVGIALLFQGAFVAFAYTASRILNFEKWFYNNGILIPGALLELYFTILIVSIMCYLGVLLLKNKSDNIKTYGSVQFFLSVIDIIYIIIIFSNILLIFKIMLVLLFFFNIISIIIISKYNVSINMPENDLVDEHIDYKFILLFTINHIISILCIYNFFKFSKYMTANIIACVILSITYYILKRTIFKNYNSYHLWISFRPSICITIVAISLYAIYGIISLTI